MAWLSILSCTPLWANVEQDMELWAPVSLEVQPSERWSGKLEAMSRWTNTLSDYQLTMLRPTIAYHWPREGPVTGEWRAGYMWAQYHTANNINEHRLFQETLLEADVPKTPLTAVYRMRNELRYFEGAGVGSPNVRNRQLVGLAFPITNTVAGLVYDEFHTNLVHNARTHGTYNQNRIYVGLSKQWRPAPARVGVETSLGYMLVHTNRRAPEANRLTHAIVAKCDVTVK